MMSSSRVVPPLRRRPGNRRENTATTSGGGDSRGVNAVGADAAVGVDVDDLCDENVPLVTRGEDETAHSIAMAEAEVLKARCA